MWTFGTMSIAAQGHLRICKAAHRPQCDARSATRSGLMSLSHITHIYFPLSQPQQNSMRVTSAASLPILL